MVDGEAERIVRMVLDAAVEGDMAAAKLVIDRILPPMKERPVSFCLPNSLATAADVNGALSAILAAVAAGDMLPSEAQTLAAIVEARRRTLETEELERRVAALEERGKA